MYQRLFVLYIMIAASGLYAGLTADTTHPSISTFELGEKVSIVIKNDDLPQTLEITVADEFDRPLKKLSINLKENEELIIPMIDDKLGFYRVFFKKQDGTPAIAALGSRPAGELTYAIVPLIANRKLYPNDRTIFGIHGSNTPAVAEALPYLGLRHVVASRFWNEYEKNYPGEFVETREKMKKEHKPYPDDSTFGVNASYQTPEGKKQWVVYPLPSLFRTPQWKNNPVKAGTIDSRLAPLTPEGEKFFAQYCYAAAKAYCEDYPDLNVRYYQITWEPHYPWGFTGDFKQLAKIYEVAYPAIHQADPRAVVIGPCYAGLTPKGLDLVQSALAAGVGKYIDALSQHTYIAYPPESGEPVEMMRRLREIIKQYCHKELPILGTEQGFQTTTLNCELDKARGDIRMALIMLGENCKMHQSFYLFDYLSEPGYGFYYSLDPKLSWGPKRLSPKAGVPAIAAMTSLLEGSVPISRIDFLGEGILGYVYETDSGLIAALWKYRGGPKEINFPVGTNQVTVYDWMGNAQSVKAIHDSIALRIGEEPVYIGGISPSIWGKSAPKLIEVPEQTLMVTPGEKSEVILKIRNDSEHTQKGLLHVVCISEFAEIPETIPVTIPARQSIPIALPIKIKSATEPGIYQLGLTFQNEEVLSQAGINIKVVPPIVVSEIAPVFIDGVPAIAFEAKSMLGDVVKLQSSVRIKGVPEARVEAASSTDVTTVLPLKGVELDTFRKYPVELIINTQNGHTLKVNRSLNFSSLPLISDWQTQRAAAWGGTLDKAEFIRDPQTLKSIAKADLSAEIRAGWTPKSLLLDVHVVDDIFMQPYSDWWTWNGDSVQLGIDLDPGKIEENTGNAFADKQTRHRHCELTFALTPEGNKVFRTISFDRDLFPEKEIDSSLIRLKAERGENGNVNYFIEIPWQSLGATRPMTAGDRIAFSLCISDRDQEKVPLRSIGIFDGIKSVKNFNHYGQFYLEGKNE